MSNLAVIERGALGSRNDFGAAITCRWLETVRGCIEVGGLLLNAKDALPHGEFGQMVRERLPFGWRTANMLMTIARHPVLADALRIGRRPGANH